MQEYCICCGHDIDAHIGWEGESWGCTYSVIIPHGEYGCDCTEFKLDNLRLIEDIAKTRNLI